MNWKPISEHTDEKRAFIGRFVWRPYKNGVGEYEQRWVSVGRWSKDGRGSGMGGWFSDDHAVETPTHFALIGQPKTPVGTVVTN